ncbi:MAG: hypothetical protein U5K00_09690 [Melioribacteraceae bacterium]|nr:hypothetical protein [Melioribacteraceae bacterium]
MRFKDLLKLLLTLILFSFFAACSSDDDDGPTEPDDNGDSPPTINVKQISVPQTMQTAVNNGDPGAAQAMTFMNLANSLPSYAQLFNPPQGSGKVSSTSAASGEWTWTQDGTTFTLVSNETSSGYELTLTIDGTFGGKTYSNQILMTSTLSKDGNTGEVLFYDPDSGSPALTFNWETEADGTYHLDMVATGADIRRLYRSAWLLIRMTQEL